ncbi:MAG: hypothetical protein IPH93_05520 [Saprospiraceae bacterium]|nr:hypothetical protein [Saprospiraceae bacterium]
MFSSVNEVKIETLHLFPILDQLLIDLLKLKHARTFYTVQMVDNGIS